MDRERWDLPGRVTNAVSRGGKMSIFLRLVVSFSVLLVLGVSKLVCNFNYISAKGGFGTGIITIIGNIFYVIGNALGFAYIKIPLLLSDSLFFMTTEMMAGDKFMIILYAGLLGLGIFPLVSIFLDILDGSPLDVAPLTHKLIVTLAVMILTVLIVQVIYGEDTSVMKISTDFTLNPQERLVCKQTGELPLYVPRLDIATNQTSSIPDNSTIVISDKLLNLTSTENLSVGNVLIENR